MTDLSPNKLLTLPKQEAEREFNALSTSSQAMLTLLTPWEKRQEIMLLSKKFPALVRSMPVEELFWTIKSTGPEDSLPLISAASFEQLQFILDLDWWDKDNLRLDRVSAWLIMLFEAGEDTVNSWLSTLRSKDPYLIPAIMRHFVDVQKRPDDMEIEEAKDVLNPFTIDNVYYIAFKNEKFVPMWERMTMKILEISDGFYRDCMETILTETRTECIEKAWRLRCGRLADFGIPDYFSALDIYAPVKPHDLRRAAPAAMLDGTEGSDMPAFVPTLYITDFPGLATALAELSDTPDIARIIREWTGVANKILMTDRIDLDDPDTMKKALSKAASLINLGIETTADEYPVTGPVKILSQYVLEDLVRAAIWRLSGIRQRVRNIARDTETRLLPPEYSEIFEALARPVPMRWDENLQEAVPFYSLEQVEDAEKTVDELEAWHRIMEKITPHWHRWRDVIAWENTNFLTWNEFTWQHGLATAVANFILDGSAVVVPVAESRLFELKNTFETGKWGTTSAQIAQEFSQLSNINPEMAKSILEKAVSPVMEEILPVKEPDALQGRFLSSLLVDTGIE